MLQSNIKYKFRILLCYDNNEDDIFEYKKYLESLQTTIIFVKNYDSGPCNAVKTGFENIVADCVIVYPADDFINLRIINEMFRLYKDGADIVVPSRFMQGGSMKNCPILKSIIVRVGNYSLRKLSSTKVHDASNGFRLFSKKILKNFTVESNLGFTYSIELLVKAHRYGYNIVELPSKWIERDVGESNFKIFKWIISYFHWYLYCLKTSWFGLKRK